MASDAVSINKTIVNVKPVSLTNDYRDYDYYANIQPNSGATLAHNQASFYSYAYGGTKIVGGGVIADFYLDSDDYDATANSDIYYQHIDHDDVGVNGTASITPDNCSLTLFDKTLLRGESITLVTPSNSTVPDLSKLSFDDRLISFEIKGPCCWKLFENYNFTGKHKAFSKGEYKSSTILGPDLAKEASSVLVTDC